MTTHQHSTDPADTAHLHAGDRITLEELATHLSAAAVWLRQLGIAAERPAVPVEFNQLCEELGTVGNRLAGLAETVAEVDAIITEERPLARTFGGTEPWGFAAYGVDPTQTKYGKRLSTVLTHHQIKALTRSDAPWRADHAEPGVSYLDGLDGLPGLGTWESKRAAERRAAEREQRIREQTRNESCTTCGAQPGRDCQTRTGRLAEMPHQGRRQSAVATIDQDGAA
ncbi:hypothetical protein SAMN04489727_1749 [Amycolatopsis tolypomycina]|uniref:DNA-binding phage zinc finger domain-containing protein n=1 Tax=Amycolatopsis tolypomycina TaxID=208445 RepID=A0A1H4JCD1_9PSEU|nr:hypothetical protein [Amycolatopsis tolypomycina]SEB43861.1 hypothetical protein SAMN04489727_1749 [Amycolatopsis tolypomycina]